jgi:L-aminopeptidase/D-esterase-like protein
VVLAEAGAVAGVDVRGSAPGTRETDLLDPVNLVQQVHAIVLAGGSAFGLDVATGVMRYLEERGIGFDTGVARVPIVPAAILFDLGVGDRPGIRPDAACGYQAAETASGGPVAEGNVGAGAGATVGKLGGGGAMKAGVGTTSIRLPDGLVVAALMVVNAVGDIIDPATGRVIAGVRTEDGRGLADARTLVRSGRTGRGGAAENTTIGVVATNARLDKAQATKMAQMAHDGLARAISPAHTPRDGDTIFALATGQLEADADVGLIGALAAEAVADAIVRAARQATGIPGYPAARDLEP